MAKVAVALRLRPEVLAAVDARAREAGASRQALLESFVDLCLDESEPGLPEPESIPAPQWKPAPSGLVPSLMASRQARLNKEMGWDR